MFESAKKVRERVTSSSASHLSHRIQSINTIASFIIELNGEVQREMSPSRTLSLTASIVATSFQWPLWLLETEQKVA